MTIIRFSGTRSSVARLSIAAAVVVLLTLVVLLAPVVLRSDTAWAQGFEAIPAYDVDIAIEASGDIVITEVIDYDFGSASRHGIFRNIPVRFRYDNRYERIYPLDVISVQGSPGTPDEYEEETSGGTSG